jgi:hypothetical protein
MGRKRTFNHGRNLLGTGTPELSISPARYCLMVFAIAACTGVYGAKAAPLCADAARAKAEGSMPIPESAFNERAARRELKKLQTLLASDAVSADAVAWETSFVYLEGWYLKRRALLPTNIRPAQAVSDFCDFLRERAYVHH